MCRGAQASIAQVHLELLAWMLTALYHVQRSASQSSYDSLYEEANNLLKNLHFQRLLRHIPESPEPAEKSAALS